MNGNIEARQAVHDLNGGDQLIKLLSSSDEDVKRYAVNAIGNLRGNI